MSGRAGGFTASWNDGSAKTAIVDFVARVTKEGAPDFVPAAERIATFDNDGTLWSEQPLYFQFIFMIDRVKALAPEHPDGRRRSRSTPVLAGDMRSAGERRGGASSSWACDPRRMTTDEFDKIVTELARHRPAIRRSSGPIRRWSISRCWSCWPTCGRTGFKTYIVSGGGIEFMRTFSEKVYGVRRSR